MQRNQFVSVILDKGIDKPLDYRTTTPLAIGTRVLVPIHHVLRKGTVIAFKDTPEVPTVQLVQEVLSEKSMITPALFTLAKWISSYYCTCLRKTLHRFLPPSIRNQIGEKKQLFVQPLLSKKQLLAYASSLKDPALPQAKIIASLIKTPQGLLLADLLKQSKTSMSPIATLEKKGVLQRKEIQIDRSLFDTSEFFPTKPKQLNREQQQALDRIIADLNTFKTHLLHGVTGSGKTEIYLQAICAAKDLDLGVILLVPEIALTTQTIERLKSRFSEKMGILHHRLSDGEHCDMWHAIHNGKIKIVVGPRSAIFSPVHNLGLVIVDEEHDSSYKQSEQQPCYHARDIAIVRGKIEQATVVLGSATPSMESYTNGQRGKYSLSTLQKRATHATLHR